jgi:peroxiredoxin Q/BCP
MDEKKPSKKTVAASTKKVAPKAPVAKKASAKPAATAKAKPAKAAKSGASKGLDVGDRAPEFSLADQDGTTVSSGSLRGKPYVLYFYPKDDTPGCTREACGFRDRAAAFAGTGVRVLGISPDKPESHTRFREKYDLEFTLLSDVDKAVARAFGVWVKKQNYGREYMGIERSTFLVGADGAIRKIWHNVKVDGHVDAVHAAAADI